MLWRPLALSFEVAFAATGLSLAFGILLGALLATRRLFARDVLDALIASPMALPPTVLGYYVLVLLGRRSALGGLWERLTGHSIVFSVTGAVLAATIGSLPIVVKSARAALENVDGALLAAARTLGAGPLRTFFTVRLPLASPGIAAGTMLGFARSLGDFGVTLMVAGDIPGETQTASLAIYDAIQAGREHDAVGMVAVLTVVVVSALYAMNLLTRRREDG